MLGSCWNFLYEQFHNEGNKWTAKSQDKPELSLSVLTQVRRTNQIMRYHIEVTYTPGRGGKGVIFEGVHNLSLIDEYRKVTNTIGNLQLRTRVLFPKAGRPNRSSKLGSTFSILDFRNESLKELWKRYFLRIQCECHFFEKVRAKISQDNPELSHYVSNQDSSCKHERAKKHTWTNRKMVHV